MKTITKKEIKQLIKEIINGGNHYNPYSGALINNVCEKCGMPENACNCENAKQHENSNIAKVSGMNLIKEFIDKEVRKVLSEQESIDYAKEFNNATSLEIKSFLKKYTNTDKINYFIGVHYPKLPEDIKSAWKKYVDNNKKIQEVAPPVMEDTVLDLKKKYPKGSASPFKIAWSIYDKKHGKK